MWGIVPAAGQGSRMQPLAFSKELLPVGSWAEGDRERPRAVSEYLVERLVLGGATRICFVISPGKSDILEYYGGGGVFPHPFFAPPPRPAGRWGGGVSGGARPGVGGFWACRPAPAVLG